MGHCAAGLLVIALVVLASAVGAWGECNVTAFEESLSVNVTEVTCYGGADGTATIVYNESLGCSPSLFSLMRDKQLSSLTGQFKDLSTGEYALTVKFSNCETNAKGTVKIGSVDQMKFNFTFDDLNKGECPACRANATVLITGGVAPYMYMGNETNDTFVMTGLCYGNTSFTVNDSNGCIVTSIAYLPIPEVCLQSYGSVSSSSRDYWTLPKGMLPWLLAVCALVAVFLVAAVVACCAWCCVSEHTATGPKLKNVEEGNTASASLIPAGNNKDDEAADKSDSQKGDEKESDVDSELDSEADSDKEEPVKGEGSEEPKKSEEPEKTEEPAKSEEPEKPEETEKPAEEPGEKKSEKKKKKKKKKKASDDGSTGDVELAAMGEEKPAGVEDGEGDEGKEPKKKGHHKKHKSDAPVGEADSGEVKLEESA